MNSLLNRKTERNVEKEISSNKKQSINKKYISLIKNKKSSLINNLKCEKRQLPKVQYSKYSQLTYDIKKLFNKDNDKIEIKLVNMIQYKNKRLLFILKNEDLLIYEIKDDPFSLIHLHTLFSNNFMMIKYFYCFIHNDNIMFNFLSFQQIKLYEFNPDKIEFIMKKIKNYSKDRFNKYFYYMKKSERFIIFQYNEVILYDNLLSSETSLYKLDEEEEQNNPDNIRSCKELFKNLLCIIFNHSISFYNLELDNDKYIGCIPNIKPESVKLADIKGEKYLIVLMMNGIYKFNFKNFNYIEKLDLDDINSIKKIKVLQNSDLAIIYGDYNLAIYDLNYNIIKYRILTEKIIYPYKSIFFLKNLDNFTLLYNPTKFSLHAINYIKGETLAKFSDGHNRIIRCRKIYFVNYDDEINDNEKYKYYLIVNIKGYFIFTIKK